jgi:hypothetical protein
MRNALERFSEELHLPRLTVGRFSLCHPQNGDFSLRPGNPLANKNLPTKKVEPARLAVYKQFLSWGLHLKENPIKVENLVPTTG